jgi:hypothetical protein
LLCKSDGGNPKPQVNLSMDGVVLGSGVGEAHTELLATPDLIHKVIECSAANQVMHQPLTTTKHLNILYGPSEVFLESVDEVSVDTAIEATCSASKSNPPAIILWTIIQDGLEKKLDDSEISGDKVRFTPDQGVHVVVITCTATNHVVDPKSTQHKIQILYPPTTTEEAVVTMETTTNVASADTEAIDYESETEVYEITTQEGSVLVVDASDVPIVDLTLDAGLVDVEDTHDEELSDDNQEVVTEEAGVDSTTEDGQLKALVKVSISSLEDALDEPEVTYKIISTPDHVDVKEDDSKESEVENKDIDYNDFTKHLEDGTEENYYSNSTEDYEYTSEEEGVESEENIYSTEDDLKAFTNPYDERMSSDEAHKDDTATDVEDLFNQEMSITGDKAETKTKVSGLESGAELNNHAVPTEETRRAPSSAAPTTEETRRAPSSAAPKSLKQHYQASAAPTINQSLQLILFINLLVRAAL